MGSRCIADEVVKGIPLDNLFSLVNNGAGGLGYFAHLIPAANPQLPAKIALFEMRKIEDDLVNLPQVGTVVLIPLPPNVRVQIWCDTERQSVGFSPYEVGAAIMRYLLRMIEGIERADAWRSPWEKGNDVSLLKPVYVNRRVSELSKLVENYRLDNNLLVGLTVLPSNGTILITQEWAGGIQEALIGFDGEKLDGGQIRLTPYLNDVARGLPAAVEDLRRLRSAIEGAAGIKTQVNQNERNRDSDHWTYPTFEERATIVKDYRLARSEGKVANKDHWAQNKYQITGRTLKRYEDEYDLKTDT